MDTPKGRGGTVVNPADTKYSLWTWTKGYAALVLLFPIYAFLWFMANVVRKLPDGLTRKLLRWHIAYTQARKRDVRIPSDETIPAYMLRWWLIKRNAFFNIYLHNILRSDDDTALHDHPWWNFSIVLEGGYFEHTIAEGGIHNWRWFGPGQMQFRWHGAGAHRLQLPSRKHQIGFRDEPSTTTFMDDDIRLSEHQPIFELREDPATSIFITGPVLRRWGFHHESGWVDAYDWDEFRKARGISTMKMSGYAEQLAKPDA